MKWRLAIMIGAAVGCSAAVGFAQLAIVTNREPVRVFSGPAKNIPIIIYNAGRQKFDDVIQAHTVQTSSATAVRLGQSGGRKFQSLPGQTILGSMSLDFPAVNARTMFLVEWLMGSNRVIGQTEVMVYPTNLLRELNLMFAGDNLGVLDPNGMLKPALKKNGVKFLDLNSMMLEDFSGRLVILGPFQSRSQVREGLGQTIRAIAKKGVAVVWIQAPPEPIDEIKPSFYAVPEGKGAVMIVQPELVADFSENPESQLNLIYLCKLALNPSPLPLPSLTSQP